MEICKSERKMLLGNYIFTFYTFYNFVLDSNTFMDKTKNLKGKKVQQSPPFFMFYEQIENSFENFLKLMVKFFWLLNTMQLQKGLIEIRDSKIDESVQLTKQKTFK